MSEYYFSRCTNGSYDVYYRGVYVGSRATQIEAAELIEQIKAEKEDMCNELCSGNEGSTDQGRTDAAAAR